MTAAAAGAPQPSRRGSPTRRRQVRDALGDAADFAGQWRSVLNRAKDRLDLSEVHEEVLEAWRRIAWLTRELGPEGYRRMLADAQERAHTGGRPVGSLPCSRLRTELGLE